MTEYFCFTVCTLSSCFILHDSFSSFHSSLIYCTLVYSFTSCDPIALFRFIILSRKSFYFIYVFHSLAFISLCCIPFYSSPLCFIPFAECLPAACTGTERTRWLRGVLVRTDDLVCECVFFCYMQYLYCIHLIFLGFSNVYFL